MGNTVWTILNYDHESKIVFLYSRDENKNIELPINLFESYILDGYILGADKDENKESIELKR